MGIRRWPVNSLHKSQQRGKCFYLMTSSCIMKIVAVMPFLTNTHSITDQKWASIGPVLDNGASEGAVLGRYACWKVYDAPVYFILIVTHTFLLSFCTWLLRLTFVYTYLSPSHYMNPMQYTVNRYKINIWIKIKTCHSNKGIWKNHWSRLLCSCRIGLIVSSLAAYDHMYYSVVHWGNSGNYGKWFIVSRTGVWNTRQ